MKILVLNAGSSSLKWQVLDMPAGNLLAKGLAERIGEKDKGILSFPGKNIQTDLPGHQAALEQLKNYLDMHSDLRIEAVGHRVVHGGNTFVQPVLIDKKVKDKIRSLYTLAPLHNPPNMEGIEAAEQFFPGLPQVAVFDTAFHQSIPEIEHRYAIPEKFYAEGIRQYGFHGISHSYIARKVAEKTQGAAKKVISLHLGNGASATAIRNGKSVAHSMGFGPLPGLIMGTRSGDIDPSVLLFWMKNENFSADEISNILNKQSGMSALAGYNDMREVEKRYAEDNSRARLALDMYVRRIRKYTGAFAAVMNGLDALVFTAGIGEHSVLVREKVCVEMDFLGIRLDVEKNKNPQDYDGEIQSAKSQVRIFVIPTNEELEIASQTYRLLQ
jgi:acetate kinase